jgi:hypothetical protein
MSDGAENSDKYSGILTKMGRSVTLKKVNDGLFEKVANQSKKDLPDTFSIMPNSTKKKTIF